MTKTCKVCDVEIPEGRLKAMPGTTTCVNHSTTERFVANVVVQGNSEAGELNSDVEIVRDPSTISKMGHYEKQVGQYK